MNYNQGGQSTAMKGVVRLDFNFAIGAAGAVGVVEQGKAGQVSVALISPGLYRCTLVAPRPQRKITIIPQVECASAATSLEAFYVRNTYVPATGVFDIQVVTRANPPVAAAPASGDTVQVSCCFARNAN